MKPSKKEPIEPIKLAVTKETVEINQLDELERPVTRLEFDIQQAYVKDVIERQIIVEQLCELQNLKRVMAEAENHKKAMVARVKELTELASVSQKVLQAQIVRSSTLTEVLRFIRVEAPDALYQAMLALLEAYDKPDRWWMERTYLRVWQWAGLLVPQKRAKWEKFFGNSLTNEEEEDKKVKDVPTEILEELTQ